MERAALEVKAIQLDSALRGAGARVQQLLSHQSQLLSDTERAKRTFKCFLEQASGAESAQTPAPIIAQRQIALRLALRERTRLDVLTQRKMEVDSSRLEIGKEITARRRDADFVTSLIAGKKRSDQERAELLREEEVVAYASLARPMQRFEHSIPGSAEISLAEAANIECAAAAGALPGAGEMAWAQTPSHAWTATPWTTQQSGEAAMVARGATQPALNGTICHEPGKNRIQVEAEIGKERAVALVEKVSPGVVQMQFEAAGVDSRTQAAIHRALAQQLRRKGIVLLAQHGGRSRHDR